MRFIFLALLALLAPLNAHAQDKRFNSVRIENETMLSLPFERTEALWSFMKERFKGDVEFDDMRFYTVESIESFEDTYYDTPDRKLLKAWAGLRHRQRIGEGGATKELIQLKTTPNLAGDAFDQNRSEIKFEVRERLKEGKVLDETNELLFWVKPTQKKDLIERLATYGIDAESLARLIVITQERRRIYFRQKQADGSEKQFFTTTLDITNSSKFWYQVQFSQLELEIGENTFTKANDAERLQLLKIQGELLKIFKDYLPELTQDQAPKVVKVFNLLESQGVLAHLMVKMGDFVLLSVGALALLVMLWFMRPERKRTIRKKENLAENKLEHRL